MVLAIFAGVILALVLGLLSVHAFITNARAQSHVGRQVLAQHGVTGAGVWADLEHWLQKSQVGRRLKRELSTAGLNYPVGTVLMVGIGLSVLVPWLLWTYVAPVFAVLGLLTGWVAIRWWIKRQRLRYRDRFVEQIPDLARVLSNATNAGLSIRTAWTVAEREMGEPARTEIGRINTAVRFGASLEEAMLQVEERLPSREVKVLMSTLVIASRSGGSLVAALRDISYMLDDRKETKREVRSIITQAVATGYAIMAMGVGLLLILNLIMPGTIERMTQHIVGQGALVVGGLLMLLGYYLIRRITRLDL
ncbi:type II secretion system F family protein [Ornithinimicrobium pekingense]|uniref:Membrane protein n=1 Tax=Ornithinimicrobium pekingense TaxID=384677 RepID=A0ABQ2FES7_9MICO|nr:type II secretion system F family protein [Ornithinimicrobium pekingense]GGK80485.1 membrane protein [Ornithinimicrobium pekingense]